MKELEHALELNKSYNKTLDISSSVIDLIVEKVIDMMDFMGFDRFKHKTQEFYDIRRHERS